MLDRSKARVRTLIAAAGYGKTTLAEQWVATGGKRWAWYTVRRSSVDVAALALGIARSCTAIVPDCDERLRAHLKAVSAPAGSSRVLAEILCEDLEDWPGDAWLLIDDYQEIAGSEEAESFVGDLVGGCPVQVVLTSRQRPSWVTARSILYGEVLEVPQAALAMDRQEAAEVLSGWSGQAASGLVALANGWPAVIGLAGVSAAEIHGEGDLTVPESIYRFFAEEVFAALGDKVRAGLTLLSLAPVLDRELAGKLLGEDGVGVVCDVALDTGILVERDARLELHPLARPFLEEQFAATASPSAIATCLSHYRGTRDWDAAFDLIVRRGVPDELPGLLEAALDDLLESARLSTLEEWCEQAPKASTLVPVVALAQAEVALRRGQQTRAQAYAEVAAESSELTFRALSLAGRAAHLASRDRDALALYRRAEAVAASEADRRDAAWNQVLSVVDLDDHDPQQLLDRLTSQGISSSPRDFIKATLCKLTVETRRSRVDLTDADLAWELIPSIADPMLESSFESIYANGLALAARYPAALDVASTLLETAHRYRLEFARPYGLIYAGMAQAGLRDWAGARTSLDDAMERSRASQDLFGECFALATMIRCLTQQGRAATALALPVPDVDNCPAALRAELLASRMFALAVEERLAEASEIAKEIEESRVGVEAIVLWEAVNAVVALKRNDVAAAERVSKLAESAYATGALDLLVTAYRAAPQVLNVLLRDRRHSARVSDLLRRVGDEDLLHPLGLVAPSAEPRMRLTPREREVYQLLCDGLSNRQIATVLVISESTAKRHVQNVYDKLGVHSRQALAMQAVLERSNHATSATGSSGTESSLS